MKSGYRSNALLVELLIVVMFFMLAATVLLQIFSAASAQTKRAELEINAINDAQNVADRLYAADQPEAALTEMGFLNADGVWRLDRKNYTIEATTRVETRGAGQYFAQEVRVTENGEALMTLPCSRYEEERG